MYSIGAGSQLRIFNPRRVSSGANGSVANEVKTHHKNPIREENFKRIYNLIPSRVSDAASRVMSSLDSTPDVSDIIDLFVQEYNNRHVNVFGFSHAQTGLENGFCEMIFSLAEEYKSTCQDTGAKSDEGYAKRRTIISTIEALQYGDRDELNQFFRTNKCVMEAIDVFYQEKNNADEGMFKILKEVS